MLIPTLLLILPCLISANMWDNLYGGWGVPFQLPFNFSLWLSPTGFSDLIKYSVHSNCYYNGLSINTTSPLATNDTVLSELKFNFTTGTMIAHSEQKGCVIVKNSTSIYKKFFPDTEGLLELALLLNSYTTINGYKKVDTTQVIKLMNVTDCVSKLDMYFAGNDTLEFVESTFRNGNKSSFSIDRIDKNLTTLSEYKPNPEWKCKRMRVVHVNGTSVVIPDKRKERKSEDTDDEDEDDEEFDYIEDSDDNPQSESLVDLILDYALPVGIDKKDRAAIHRFMEEFLQNYIGCNH